MYNLWCFYICMYMSRRYKIGVRMHAYFVSVARILSGMAAGWWSVSDWSSRRVFLAVVVAVKFSTPPTRWRVIIDYSHLRQQDVKMRQVKGFSE